MGKPTNWTPEKDVELMRLRAERKTYAEIAKTLGCVESTCQNRWNKISRGERVSYAYGRYSTWTAEEDAKLLELRAYGMGWVEIASRLCKSKSRCSARWHELNPGKKRAPKVESPSISPSLPRPRRMPLHRRLGIETMVVRVPVTDLHHRNRNTHYMSVTLARV